MPVCCTVCGQPYPAEGVPYRCPACGGIYDFSGPPVLNRDAIEPLSPGIWRFRHAFELPHGATVVTLGEGNTPLIEEYLGGRKIWLKMESLNPSGSYKDRGSAVLVSWLLARGVKEAVEDSSGNAGASFAAYAARAGLRAAIYVPESASGPKRLQIERYGATLVCMPGPRSAAAQAVLAAVEQGAVYASHAFLPFGLPGIATMAFEIWEQLGFQVPGTIVAPVGHGGLLLGLIRGFKALRESRVVDKVPYFIGVQAKACAPLVKAYLEGRADSEIDAEEYPTLAEGVRVRQPVRKAALLKEVEPSRGEFIAIDEPEIAQAFTALCRRGIYVEPTSALVWAALVRRGEYWPDPVVLILTGTGLKYAS
jgi:threonine synthase